MIFRHSGWLLITSLACLGAFPQSVKSLVSQPTSQFITTNVSASSQVAQAQISDGAPKVDQSSKKWWLLGIVTVSAVGGGLTFFALRRQSPSSESSPLLEPSTFSSKLILEDAIEPPEARDLNDEPPSTNGHHPQPIPVSETFKRKELPEVSPTEDPQVSETTRLAKISIVDELLRELRTPDPAKRQKIIWELGQRGDTRAVQPMVDLMIDSDSKQRSLILSALSEIGTRTLKPLSRALAISLQDESADVRKNAIRDLTRVYDLVSQISHLLHQASDDPDRDVQETAVWALGQLNRMRSAPTSAENLPAFKQSVSPPENLP
ncbi:PBS lyase [Phormidesmis priestleyi ULC007]|uniref:PBS lyase n=1 Tax=Phormidesmis priestleyi ULC007 TaxID=1920490 RepID=A0A2T1D876_9CYAN|nr:HEAT repeat domain-containing protein [Phormidesmis priestleyi]PSB16719.1 PBS lyase [Phormidesmis priestleyi ULC007]PZO47580.1 MAG: PBS lyase [Phormidesmis priestleyi]